MLPEAEDHTVRDTKQSTVGPRESTWKTSFDRLT